MKTTLKHLIKLLAVRSFIYSEEVVHAKFVFLVGLKLVGRLNIKGTLGKVLLPQCRKLAPCTHAIVFVHIVNYVGHTTRLESCPSIPSYTLVAFVTTLIVICAAEQS